MLFFVTYLLSILGCRYIDKNSKRIRKNKKTPYYEDTFPYTRIFAPFWFIPGINVVITVCYGGIQIFLFLIEKGGKQQYIRKFFNLD